MRALLIGATGATGTELVNVLIQDEQFTEIVVFVRRPYFKAHAKLTEIVVEFEKLEEHVSKMFGDVSFSCLGTTLHDAGSKDKQWRVDHDYQLRFAELCRAQQVPSFVLLSALGANKNSIFFYNRMKGTLEEDVKQLGFPSLTIVQPGLLLRPNSRRVMELVAGKLIVFLNKIGLSRSYKATTTEMLARAMVAAYRRTTSGVSRYSPSDYFQFDEI
ncbi:NAD(P)H-binding protein [Sphingobacterium suaedae]|uniref:NAD(P)H-binding protein n=1 Tax=Sphingobacterium suaedae TaxID=1686402 RepID=A0ABW5KH98_9SPHI